MKFKKNIIKKDRIELTAAISAFKLQMSKGIANMCPLCLRKGNFGSILSYECESGNKFLLCGWCGNASSMTGK